MDTDEPENRDDAGQYLTAHTIPGPGRKPIYDPSMNETAHNLALLGLTDKELAAAFGIGTSTFYEWMKRYPAFSEAVHGGKIIADGKVARALYRRAIGEHIVVETVRKGPDGEYQKIELRQEVPPDASAALNWLKNRQPDRWRDKQEVSVGSEQIVYHVSDQPMTEEEWLAEFGASDD